METQRQVEREILLAFWKVHILHHAAERPVFGQWVAGELRRHGYAISPGTLYPLLARMAEHGWLEVVSAADSGPRARREYRLTPLGQRVLDLVRGQVGELYREVVPSDGGGEERAAPEGGSSAGGTAR